MSVLERAVSCEWLFLSAREINGPVPTELGKLNALESLCVQPALTAPPD